jgi:hypothetical protein
LGEIGIFSQTRRDDPYEMRNSAGSALRPPIARRVDPIGVADATDAGRLLEPDVAKLGVEVFCAAECTGDAVARYAELAGDGGERHAELAHRCIAHYGARGQCGAA